MHNNVTELSLIILLLDCFSLCFFLSLLICFGYTHLWGHNVVTHHISKHFFLIHVNILCLVCWPLDIYILFRRVEKMVFLVCVLCSLFTNNGTDKSHGLSVDVWFMSSCLGLESSVFDSASVCTWWWLNLNYMTKYIWNLSLSCSLNQMTIQNVKNKINCFTRFWITVYLTAVDTLRRWDKSHSSSQLLIDFSFLWINWIDRLFLQMGGCYSFTRTIASFLLYIHVVSIVYIVLDSNSFQKIEWLFDLILFPVPKIKKKQKYFVFFVSFFFSSILPTHF